jgi:hypothetical protein
MKRRLTDRTLKSLSPATSKRRHYEVMDDLVQGFGGACEHGRSQDFHVDRALPGESKPGATRLDPSGGSSDSFTLAISHRDGERFVIDAIREVKPPFSPEAVIDEFATLVRSYGSARVVGDRYAGEFPREQFRKRGIHYAVADKPKSDLYRDLLPLLNSGRIVLPRSDRLINQLTGLERRTSRAGKDSIDHGPGQHDDIANAVAGAADLVVLADRRRPPVPVQTTYSRRKREQTSPLRQRIEGEMCEAVPMCLIDFSNQTKGLFDG